MRCFEAIHRLALYGLDFLIAEKQREHAELDERHSTEEVIRLREELSEQLKSLRAIKEMAARYGYDVSNPATTGREAVQWTYFAYLAAIKEQNGAAMSVGRISTFLDIYLERDLREGTLTESEAQELIDDLVIKFRLGRFLRTPEYNQLFSGDPTWGTEFLAGSAQEGSQAGAAQSGAEVSRGPLTTSRATSWPLAGQASQTLR